MTEKVDDDGSVVFPKNNPRNIYNKKYQETCANNFFLQRDYIKDTRIHWVHSGRKQFIRFYVS